MPRNLDRRVEALVAGDRSRRWPRGSTRSSTSCMQDDMLAWTLGPDGTWTQGARRARDRRAAASPGAGGRARGVARGVSKTAASSNLERETKLEAPAGFRIPELGGDGLVATEMEPQRLVTVYVDTPDLRIVRWGSSLRHRQGEGEKVWTVKLPSSGNGSQLVRTEVNFEGADARKLPTAAADLVRALRPRRGARARRSAADRPSRRPDLRRRRDPVGDGDGRRGVGDGRAARRQQVPRAGGRARSRRRCGALGRPRRAPQGGRRRSRRQHPQVRSRARPARRGPARSRGPRARRARGRDRGRPTGARDVGGAAAPPRCRGPAGRRPRRACTRRGWPRGALRSALRTFRDVLEPEWAASLRDRLRWLGRRARRRARHRGPARPDPLEGADAARGRPQGRSRSS